MTRDELATDTADTVTALNEKVRAALDLGKPGETVDYATALHEASAAYDHLDTDGRD